jgi:hypothetical protein
MTMRLIVLISLLICSTASAEWYRVIAVPAYNTIRASQAEGEKEPINIRIRNLEKIEYIQSDPEKVLIGGKEAIGLSRNLLLNQLVWVENLQPEEGAYVGDVYPSFEQVVTVYKETRIINGDNISPESKEKLLIIYKQMLADLNLASLTIENSLDAQQSSAEARAKIHHLYKGILTDFRNNAIIIKDGEQQGYENEFERTMFTADAIIWFRKNGQFIHPAAQKLYADLLQSFQTDVSQNARYTQMRIVEIQKKQDLFKELFIDSLEYQRGKFTYTCMDWFKNRGQFLPQDVQAVFINWLRLYQQTNGSDSQFMQERLQWMIDNNGLYQDFLGLDK